jgi:hypothetical protein
MITVSELLSVSGVRHERYAKWPRGDVYLTAANQLIGAYAGLKSFQSSDRNYLQWQAHHIVEYQDLVRLDVAQTFPPRERQICVLIPERAHIGRVNSILRMENPTNLHASVAQLRQAYRAAYSLIGDYCGGGEIPVRRELMAIVDAIFDKMEIRR